MVPAKVVATDDILEGQAMIGFWMSVTIIVCIHVAFKLLPSVAVQVMVVTPFG